MKKGVACLLFFLNTILFATYYSVSKEALDRIDPIVFSFFEMIALLPVALCILFLTRKQLTREIVKRGVLVGSWLCLSLFTIAIALKYTSATSTAFFPALNGIIAALIAWAFFKQPLTRSTWIAGIISLLGALLLILNSPMGGPRGTLIAFLGGFFFTCYIFLSDHEQREDIPPWPLFGIELLTMALWANLVVLLFGNWQAVHPQLPKDILVIVYIAGATTFLPTLIAVLMQKHISPVTISFIYILEPILGALFAALYLHEHLPIQGYLGGGLVVVGAIIQTWVTSQQGQQATTLRRYLAFHNYRLVGIIGLPLLLLSLGFLLLYGLGGFPPKPVQELLALWPMLPTLSNQGQKTFVFLLWVQVGCWVIAWLAFGIIGVLTAFRLAHKLLELGDVPAVSMEQVPKAPLVAQLYHEQRQQRQHSLQEQPTQPLPGEQPWTMPISASLQRRREKALIQQRRQNRLQRLGATDIREQVD
jgi:drug/metabolite transporter (DMT)-like permease